MKTLAWDDVDAALARLGIDRQGVKVFGVPRGGLIAAGRLRHATVTYEPGDADVILDDIIDSGRTAAAYAAQHPGKPFAALVHGCGEWIRFPWELHEEAGPEDAVVRMLQFIGEDPKREGLIDTPARVVRSWSELFGGYKQNPADILARRFQQFGEYNEMVVLRNIPFSSMCEHHILPFYGTATVGYIPQGAVIGISKIARLVRCFARRLQVQERMTVQIGEALAAAMSPLGVGVVLKATHLCMTARGVMVHDTEMVTTKLIGNFMNAAIRAEFLDAAR